MNELHFVLEVPVEPSRALRAWPPGLARLFIIHGPTRSKKITEDRLIFFAHWLKKLLSEKTNKLYSYPINVNLSGRQLNAFMQAAKTNGDVVCIDEPFHWLIACENTESLLHIMRQSAFERVVFWGDTNPEEARRIALRAGAQGDCGDDRDDTPFAQLCTSDVGFIFYSFTHDNLEVVGNRDFILRRCLPLVDLEGQAPLNSRGTDTHFR